MHFIGDHASVYHSEYYRDGQERLEDLPLPSRAHSVAHDCCVASHLAVCQQQNFSETFPNFSPVLILRLQIPQPSPGVVSVDPA